MKVLLIRLRLVGDVVFTTPAVRALRRAFPDARLTYLVERGAAPVVAHNPHLDEVIPIAHTRGWSRVVDDLRLARELRRRRFDLVIDFHGGPRGSWLAWASGAPRRIGYTIPGRSWMYTDRVERPRSLRPRHSVENQWDLLRPLGIDAPDRSVDAVEMAVPHDVRARVAARLETAGVPESAGVIVIHVSAGNPFRRWPAEAFASLAAGLVREDVSRRVVLTSGPSEADAAHAIARAARATLPAAAAPRILECGDFDLLELRALVERAALYIGGDSGPLHVAGTTRTPIVALFGPTLAARSMPYRDRAIPAEAVEPGPLPCRPCDQRVCAPGDFRCLAGIAPGRVLAAAERLLARGRTERPAITLAPDAAPVGS